MFKVGYYFLSTKKEQKEGFFLSFSTLLKLQKSGTFMCFLYDVGFAAHQREHLMTLSAEEQIALIVSSIKASDEREWDGSPIFLDDRYHDKWYWLIPELNEHPLEGIKEMVDARYPQPCFRNTSKVEMFPSSYAPVSSL